ncbi:ankyrin repeat-containing domain protein, partial [Flagelloscypha sp. PMI_526]
MFTNPTRILMNELQNCFPKGSNVACVVSISAGYSDAYFLVPGGISMENSQSSEIVADEFTSQCHELGPFFFHLSLPSSLPRLTSLKDTYSQLKGATMAYLDSHAVTTMLDDLADALTERPEVVPLERLVQQHLDDSLFRDINNWLQPIQQTSKLDSNIRDRGETTCQWILENPTFKRWMKAKGGVFWYHGLMGTGKTMTMSFIAQRLLADLDIHVAYYYFEFTNPTTLSEEALLRSLIAQLAPAAPEVARVLHQQHNGAAHQPQLATLQTALHNLASDSVKPIFIFIDALDELPPAQRKYLLQYLLIFCSSPNAARTHFMVTSREDRDICTAFENADFQLGVQGGLVRQDIAAYVDQQLAAKKWSLWPSGEVEMMRKVLNERADGQFRMVACQVDILKTITTSRKLVESLHSLPKTLASTYEYILDQIPKDLRGAARTLFAALSFTDGFISIPELAALVAVDFGDGVDSDHLPVFHEANHFHDPLDLLDLGTSFVSETKYEWEQEGHLQLAHASVKEYLLVDSGGWLALQERPAHSLIAGACLALLHHSKIFTPSAPQRQTPFEYSLKNWFKHIFPNSPPMLLCQQQTLYSTFPWLVEYLPDRGYQQETMLNSAAAFGLLDFLKACLITSPWNDDALGSALIAAVDSTRASLFTLPCCHLLLHHGARVEYCRDNRNALQTAAYTQNLEIVKFLLENGADVNATRGKYGTALQAAVFSGDLEIASILLEWGADINAPGGTGEAYGTVLHAMSNTGNLEFLKFLLEIGADINARGVENGTALQSAAYRGKLEAVKFLVENDADINVAGGMCGTALQAAAIARNLEIVKFLCEKGADVNGTGEKYGSALQAAAESGKLETVKFLWEKGADVNAPGGEHGTALQAAACRGYQDIVKFLVENGGDVNATGGEYGTALQAAAHAWNLEIVKFLVENGADANAMGGEYGTPLQILTYYGSLDIIKFLLEKGADVNAVGGYLGSALQAAAECGNLEAVKFLWEKGADVNATSGEYGTALQAAACTGNLEVVKFLVEKGAIVNARGGKFGTPLDGARANSLENDFVERYLMDFGAKTYAEQTG